MQVVDSFLGNEMMWAIVPATAAQALEKEGKARICRCTDPPPDRMSFLVTRRGETLSEAAQLGVAEVWLTSHVMEDCPNTPDGLRERFEELKQAIAQAGIQTPQLHLSAENMMDELFESRLEQGIVLPHLDRHLLGEVEGIFPHPCAS